ncbi:MAG: hypothetical protein FWG10_12460 [Eubacteriaceae bacterium]|nr:hypothetical protein [Eubacteriaceae bacterium]
MSIIGICTSLVFGLEYVFVIEYSSIKLWKEQFEQGETLAVEKRLGFIFSRSRYPKDIQVKCDLHYDDVSKTVVVSFVLPTPESISDIVGYKIMLAKKQLCR